jgi:uncharacterized membrane protein YeaQ/YmgE (transglycosylase-associated protein family)
MTMTFVQASVFGTLWAWLVWIVIGGLAGALADRWIQGDRLGIVGNVIVGILGGLIGGAILGLFGIGGQGIIWTFVTALLGAALCSGSPKRSQVDVALVANDHSVE